MNFEQKLSGFVRNGSARQAMLRKELGLDPYEATKLRVKEKLERDVEYRTSILKGIKTLQALSSEEMRQACESMEEQVSGVAPLLVAAHAWQLHAIPASNTSMQDMFTRAITIAPDLHRCSNRCPSPPPSPLPHDCNLPHVRTGMEERRKHYHTRAQR
jgi:hypothetical protein